MSDDTMATPAAGAATDTSVPSTAAATTPTPPATTVPTPPEPPAEPARKPVEQWQLDKGVHGWLVAFAATQNRWPQGRELTEAEFDVGIKAAFEIAFR